LSAAWLSAAAGLSREPRRQPAPRLVEAQRDGVRGDLEEVCDVGDGQPVPRPHHEELPVVAGQPRQGGQERIRVAVGDDVGRIGLGREGDRGHLDAPAEAVAAAGRPPLVGEHPAGRPEQPEADVGGWNVVAPAPGDRERLGGGVVGLVAPAAAAAREPPHVGEVLIEEQAELSLIHGPLSRRGHPSPWSVRHRTDLSVRDSPADAWVRSVSASCRR
jgi:hypothetical protein